MEKKRCKKLPEESPNVKGGARRILPTKTYKWMARFPQYKSLQLDQSGTAYELALEWCKKHERDEVITDDLIDESDIDFTAPDGYMKPVPKNHGKPLNLSRNN
eukprot:TRINITY_DN14618_c0_g1_i1.p1 TRINITY_DN14618_c0_g1~~TRINITY_DN14618_c0_g1_i1.p1  ORF type:complete len:103 (+),score=15.08 TRINITY_DN14618_c0_g1_i1:163-471(+)